MLLFQLLIPKLSVKNRERGLIIMAKKEVFNTIEEARAYLNEAPVLLEKAKKGKKMRSR